MVAVPLHFFNSVKRGGESVALGGYFYNYPIQDSDFGISCIWSAQQDQRHNRTAVTVNVYLSYYNISVGARNGRITIGSSSYNFISPEIEDRESDHWHSSLIGTYTDNVYHDEYGRADNVPLVIEWDFEDTYNGVYIDSIIANAIVDLDAFITYSLNITADNNSQIEVLRTYSFTGNIGRLYDGDNIYPNDKLRIMFYPLPGHEVVNHMVNDETFVSGGIISVDGDVSVMSTSKPTLHEIYVPSDAIISFSDGRPFSCFYQWDKNVSIVVHDALTFPLPTCVLFNKKSDEPIVVTATASDNDLVIAIPNSLLEQPEVIVCEIRSTVRPTEARTIGTLFLPVKARLQPE